MIEDFIEALEAAAFFLVIALACIGMAVLLIGSMIMVVQHAN